MKAPITYLLYLLHSAIAANADISVVDRLASERLLVQLEMLLEKYA